MDYCASGSRVLAYKMIWKYRFYIDVPAGSLQSRACAVAEDPAAITVQVLRLSCRKGYRFCRDIALQRWQLGINT